MRDSAKPHWERVFLRGGSVMSLLIAEAKRRVLVGSTMRLLSRYLASVSRYPSLLPAMIGSPAAIASTKIIPKLSPWVVGARKISECLR